MEDSTTPEQLKFQPEPVDETAVRRESVLSGMWAGIKRGGLFGVIGGIGISGVAGLAGIALGKTGAGFLTGILPKPLLLGLGASEVASGGAGLRAGMVAAAATFASVAVPIVLYTAIGGAAIGALWGGINGYMKSGEKIEQAQQKSEQVAKQKNIERQQGLNEVQRLRAMEDKLNQQTEELYAQQIGQFSAPSTPPVGQAPFNGRENV